MGQRYMAVVHGTQQNAGRIVDGIIWRKVEVDVLDQVAKRVENGPKMTGLGRLEANDGISAFRERNRGHLANETDREKDPVIPYA